uniref:Uncharacterized protein n=1 Tax=Grammatophora oceanica TaxID=210454 RepID=A0A7S1VDJ4_9STRA|mmetsp:Transcript_43584/g.64691  ORF Transcript_43584/g.64691 Transcript_43584/m.64691 type:complete len:153 (+) Transcript_43584:140-598(+)
MSQQDKQGYNKTHQPLNYIPLAHYLKQIDDSCPRTVYIATDDPITIQEEIAALNATSGLNFVLSPKPEASQGHVKDAKDCATKYDFTISMVMDLYLLVHASVFVGEFNSNWGRLVGYLRVHFADVHERVMGTAQPREIRIAFGPTGRNSPGM